MKIRILVLLSVLAWIGTATVVSGASGQAVEQTTAEAGGTPVVIMPERTYKFKPVVDGTTITHDFLIKNTGDGPLAIERVKTG